MPSGSLITIPAFPAAPATFEMVAPEIAAASVSIFTGQQQINDWGAGPREISFSLQPLSRADAVAWLTFIASLKGIVNYFALTSTFTAQYAECAGVNWRLKGNAKWSVAPNQTYRFSFDCREAL